MVALLELEPAWNTDTGGSLVFVPLPRVGAGLFETGGAWRVLVAILADEPLVCDAFARAFVSIIPTTFVLFLSGDRGLTTREARPGFAGSSFVDFDLVPAFRRLRTMECCERFGTKIAAFFLPPLANSFFFIPHPSSLPVYKLRTVSRPFC
jgi:hypothetical protein